MVLLVVYWLFILWEFLAVAKVQQKNETNKKISNKMVTNYKVPIIKIHSFTDSHIILFSSTVDNITSVPLKFGTVKNL